MHHLSDIHFALPHFGFSLSLGPIVWGLLGCALLLGLCYGVWIGRRGRRLLRHLGHDQRVRGYCHRLPSVSVVVYANDDEQFLRRFLPALLGQEYPEFFEIIVVDDASNDSTKDYISDMREQHPQLKFTFTPAGTRALSRKKLSLMTGFKKAVGEVVLTTNANCRVTSDKWLISMMRNFVPGTDIVLGYSTFHHSDDSGPGRGYRRFDDMMTTSQWLCAAIAGTPFRGISDNLAFRRELFFENKGYWRSLTLRWGDDDVFLCEILRPGNFRVEMSPRSRVIAYYDDMAHAHSVLKSRRDFTLSQVPRKTERRVNAAMSLVWWLRLACLVAAVALAGTNLAAATAAVLVMLVTAIPVMANALRCTYALRMPLTFFAAPWHTLMRPLVNIAYAVKGVFKRKSNYV